MVAIPCLLYWSPVMGLPTRIIGQALIIVAAVLTVWSMCYYLQKAWPEIKKKQL
jgi:CDP-diacylglycerol--glycerol-3-phosphate 3-phosphatidyltransferase/cardiolipin synthase